MEDVLELKTIGPEETHGRGSADLKVRVGVTEENTPEYLVLPYREVIEGNLNQEQALALLQSAEFGTNLLKWDMMATGDNLPHDQLVPAVSVLETSSAVFRSLSQVINKLPETNQEEQRQIIGNIFEANQRRGLLDMDILAKAVEAEFLRCQSEEKQRQANIDRSRRLQKLGFWDGFQGTIVGFQTAEKEIGFPYVDYSLPEEERWPDVVKRAKNRGFIFDSKGRVSGFKTEKGQIVAIPKDLRGPQIKGR